LALLKEEINVKKIVFSPHLSTEVELDFKLTPRLREEGTIRELVRRIQGKRKDQMLVPKDRINIVIEVPSSKLQLVLRRWEDLIKKETGAKELKIQVNSEELKKGININGEKLKLEIKKV